MRKPRLLLAGGAGTLAAIAVLVGLFYPRQPKSLPDVGEPLHYQRAPAGTPQIDNNAACRHLYRTVCLRKGGFGDLTGGVLSDADGERQALQIYQDLIQAHPDWPVSQIDDELVKAIYTPARRKRITAAAHWVERALIRLIERQPERVFTRAEKHNLEQRVARVQFELPPPADIYADSPDLYTTDDVYYERMADGATHMRVGGAYLLSVRSWFNMIFTLAHEYGHSIDPCEVRASPPQMEPPAYRRLTSCFLRQGLVARRKTRKECGEDDQLSETFADWIAAQITSEALQQFASALEGPHLMAAIANSVKDLCENDEDLFSQDLDVEFHPKPETRINRIFGQNPAIRDLLGCSPLPPGPDAYCSFEP